ncbi:hypothetical protein [Actinomyces bouchesdurhonensis]|jgi:hypothetical protein|uniref:hypothetical protein n=1 Tax=Actinomyces bouchesdurhonensis TaxID=1852361 RepID=UPI00093D1F85|nr:hypothetical protein [Actinomyces bouchesdurhonensis]
MTTNLEQLIKDEQAKHAAKLRKLREQAAREEQEVLVRVARLVEQREPERFTQYREHAASLIEQERVARAERVRAARARKQQSAAAYADEGGESQ